MKKQRAFRIIIPVVILTILLIILYLSSALFLNRTARVRLQDEFSKQTNGEYSLLIKSMGLNLLTQSLTFTDVNIEPDNLPRGEAYYKISSSRVNLKGLNVLRFVFSKKIQVDGIELADPSVTIVQSTIEKSLSADTTEAFSLYRLTKEFAKSISVSRFEVRNFDLTLYSHPDDSLPALHSNNNYFKVTNLYLGASTKNIQGLFKADSIALIMNQFRYTTNDSLYTFEVRKMHVSYSDSTLTIDSVNVIPNYSKRRFAEIAGKQTDRFNIFAGNLVFRKIDLRHFFENHGIICRLLEISDFSMLAFRDKNDPREYARPRSVQHLLLNAPVYLKIDSIKVANSIIAYEEIAPGKKVPGRITFNDISANFTGVTNDSMLISMGRQLEFRANCLLMNTTRLNALITFPMNTDLMQFNCSGYLAGMPMEALNPMIEPTTGISLKQGVIDTLDFSFYAGENSSKGTMKFLYHDLKLELPDPGEGRIKFKDKIALFVANTFILKESNPKGKKPPRISEMQFERNKQRFMFHYIWNTIFSGIKGTIGVPDTKKKED